MKQNTNAMKSKMSFGKRTLAAVIAVISCFSLAAAPKSLTGTNVFNTVSVNAAETKDYTVVAQARSGNDTLRPGKWYSSPNGKYFVVFDGNSGNLLLYGNTPNGRKLLWNAKSTAPGGSCIMQADGNLVIYSAYDAKHNRTAKWDTHTNRNPSSSLILTNDGDLYIKSLSISSALSDFGKSTWSAALGKRTWSARPLVWPFPGRDNYLDRYGIYTLTIGDERCHYNGARGQRIVAMADGYLNRLESMYIEIWYPELGITSHMYGIYKREDNIFSDSNLTLKKGQTIGYVNDSTFTVRLRKNGEPINWDDYVLMPLTLHKEGMRVISDY